MAAPIGNKNSTKGRRWFEALRKALGDYEDDQIKAGEALSRIARNVVKAAVAGDKDAITEIGNRLDGKPAQSMMLTGDEDSPLQHNHKVTLIGRD